MPPDVAHRPEPLPADRDKVPAVLEPLPFTTRLWFAWVCFFRVLFDPAFAARAFEVRAAMPELPPAPRPRSEATSKAPSDAEPEEEGEPEREPKAKAKRTAPRGAPVESSKVAPAASPEVAPVEPPKADDNLPALQLLALLQREGRLVDFLEQDIAAYPDADVGATARVIHEGCRKALHEHVTIAPVRTEEEGATLTLEAGFSPSEVKLTGDVKGSAPYKGVLRHRGWRATRVALPVPMKGHDAAVLAPAEVEL
jgi:hypothetical protein